MINTRVSTYSLIAVLLLSGTTVSAHGRMSRAVQFYFDKSNSSRLLEADNIERCILLVERVVCDFKSADDQFRLSAIHANTGTSSPILKMKGPKCVGSMIDYKIKEDWKNNLSPIIEKKLNLSYRKEVGYKTNIYPIIRKIQRQNRGNNETEVFIVSDMIHDYGDEDFAKDLLGATKTQVIDMAENKVQQLAIAGSLNGVVVNIRIPGTISGITQHENIRENLDIYWTHFFEATGASVDIDML